MYAWYEKAAICYAYLEDVHATVDTTSENSELTNTTWATRGWTLQLCELHEKLGLKLDLTSP
jgi:hypothetical protein